MDLSKSVVARPMRTNESHETPAVVDVLEAEEEDTGDAERKLLNVADTGQENFASIHHMLGVFV
jgi:hypothetical protein